jgi:ribosomal protein S18 acetylase RimI-like enzyme
VRNAVDDGGLRVLGPQDRPGVARMAASAFGSIDFYVDVLGLDALQLEPFFNALLRLMFRDSHARVYGLERDGRLASACVVVFPGFPSPGPGLRFLTTLVRTVGPMRLMRYLRFVRAYERAMHGASADGRSEARAYWLFVDPQVANTRCGSDLARRVMADLESHGWRLVTAFVDAANPRLLALYRRLGFTASDPFPFLGRQGVRIACRLPRMSPPC